LRSAPSTRRDRVGCLIWADCTAADWRGTTSRSRAQSSDPPRVGSIAACPC
jgi:hypothetical protein